MKDNLSNSIDNYSNLSPFYNELGEIMTPEFQDFVSKHFTDKENILTMVMFIKLYVIINKRYGNILNNKQILCIIDQCIKTSYIRGKIVENIYNLDPNNIESSVSQITNS